LSEQINWVTTNANLDWWQYWQMRYAQFYAQINHVFDNRPSNVKVGSIIAQDLSSTWADNGVNNPSGMENLTIFAQYDSFDHYYLDNERYDYALMGQYQAYVAGLVKSKIPDAHCIVGVEIGSEFPIAACRQQYLAAVETYVWKDGVQHRAVDPNWVLVWAGTTTTWTDDSTHAKDITRWVKTTAATLNSDVSPAWLGPVAVQTLFLNPWSAGPFSVNFTFAQYADALNLNNTGNNFVPEMGTVFFDAIRDSGNVIGGGAYQNLLNLYASGSLNVILSTCGYDASFSNTLFWGQGDAECSSTFKITPQTNSVSDATTLSSSQVTDVYARQIIGNTFGTKYSGYAFAGCMNSGTGLIPLVMHDNGPVQLGIYCNGTSGRFLYGNAWGNTGRIIDDREMLNRGIYWASKCPVTASDSLADIKIFTLWNGDTAISIMNKRSLNGDLPLTLDLSGLGLDPSDSYTATWAMNGNSVSITDLSSVNVTLANGADVLVIESNNA